MSIAIDLGIGIVVFLSVISWQGPVCSSVGLFVASFAGVVVVVVVVQNRDRNSVLEPNPALEPESDVVIVVGKAQVKMIADDQYIGP